MTDSEKIIIECDKALLLAPSERTEESSDTSTTWNSFEIKVWEIGENIRQLFLRDTKLKKDSTILKKIIEVIKQKNLKRGRQSFVMLLGFVGAKPFASDIALFLDDDDINGHIIDSLLKMKANGYATKVKLLVNSNHTWIKNLAKKYCERYPN